MRFGIHCFRNALGEVYHAMKAKQKYPKNFEIEIKRRSGLSVQCVISNKLQIAQYKSLLPQVLTH